jgi:hypothetical protein
MSVTVQVNTASININSGGAIPAIAFNPKNSVCHLTKGFSNSNKVASAWDATGEVSISLGRGDTLSGWQFGFIQFQKILNAAYYYVGRVPSHGSISLLVSKVPAMTNHFALDSHPNQEPYTVAQPRFKHVAPKITAPTRDHPLNKAGASITNKKTSHPNFLFHIVDHRKFWSIFTAQDANGAFTHMMHFIWEMRYDFMITYDSGGKPRVFRRSPIFKMGSPIKGPPTDKEVTPHLANPHPPNANAIMRLALNNTVSGGKPNRVDTDHWFANVPSTFFK